MRLKIRDALPFAALLASYALLAPSLPAGARNVILFIGDGMGPEQVDAASLYLTGERGRLSFEKLPHRGRVMTHSAVERVTDSAASATAYATGFKVKNGVIAMAIPGDGRELETILERFSARGALTGLVTTTAMTHATPAAFAAHEPSRNNAEEIAEDYLYRSRPDLLLGGGGEGLTPSDANAAGYVVVLDREGLLEEETDGRTKTSGQFGEGHMPYEYDGLGGLPHLSEMTRFALESLDDDSDGFFLLVEGGRIDHACHDNDLERAVHETIELSNAVDVALEWAAGRDDTLILVTADHETGGMKVIRHGRKGEYPEVTWSTGGHTATDVPIYAWGAGAARFSGLLDNTAVHRLMKAAVETAGGAGARSAAALRRISRRKGPRAAR